MTSLEQLRAYSGEKPGSREDFPFDFDTLVFKVGGKLSACISVATGPLRVNLTCEPELAVLLRNQYEAITPG